MSKNFRVTLNERLKDENFKSEYDALEPEYQLINAILDCRKEMNMTQKQLSEATGIAQGDISKIEKPTLHDFKKANVYVRRETDVNHLFAKFGKIKIEINDIPQIGMVNAIDFKKEKIEFEKIGNLKLYKQYKIGNSYRGIPLNQLLQILPNKENDEKLYGKPKTKIKLSKWTKCRVGKGEFHP